MIYASLVVLLLIAGLLVYALASNPKTVELGRLTFACAMLAICFHAGVRAVALLR